jgi:hypothetical protein
LLRPVPAATAVFALAAIWLLSASLFGGKVLSANDVVLFTPPFASERPAEVTRPSNGALGDAVFLFHPHLHQARQRIRSGELPTWDPDIGAGRPQASQQGGLLYPLHALAYALPFWESLAWIAALKLMVAALGTFFLCRALGLRPEAATLGGLSFAFGCAFVVYLQHPQAGVFSLLPWLLLATERLCRSPSLRPVLAFGALYGAAILAGHPESIFVLSLGIAAFAATRLVMVRRELSLDRRAVGRRVLLLASGVALAAALAAALVVPFYEALTQSEVRRVPGPLLDPSGGWSFFFPELWGRSDKVNFPAPDIFAGRPLYLGVMPLLLAIAGLTVRRAPVQLLFAAVFAASLLTLLDTPAADAIRLLPVFSDMAVRHFMFLAMFAAAMLAAYGLHNALEADRAEQRRMLLVMTVAAALPLAWLAAHLGVVSGWRDALGELPVLSTAPPSADAAALASVLRWVILSAVGLGVTLLMLARRDWPIAFAVFVVALSAFDLVTMDRGYNPQVAKRIAAPPDPPALARVKRIAGPDRVSGTGFALEPSLAELHDLHDIRGNELPTFKRHLRLYRALGGVANSRGNVTGLNLKRPRARDLIDLFSVRYLFLDDRDPIPTDGFRTLDSRPGQRLVENTQALPRAYVAYDWRGAGSFDEALRTTVATPPRELGRAPVIEGAHAPAPGPAVPPERAVLRTDEPRRVAVEVDAARPGQLVLTDTYYPGWKAAVDGEDTDIRPANSAFRAVAVPPGRHTVTFTYEPVSFALGYAVSGATLLFMCATLGVLALRARRRRRDVSR